MKRSKPLCRYIAFLRGMNVGGNGLFCLGKGRGVVDHHVVALQRRRQRAGHLRLILDEQNPHDPAPELQPKPS